MLTVLAAIETERAALPRVLWQVPAMPRLRLCQAALRVSAGMLRQLCNAEGPYSTRSGCHCLVQDPEGIDRELRAQFQRMQHLKQFMPRHQGATRESSAVRYFLAGLLDGFMASYALLQLALHAWTAASMPSAGACHVGGNALHLGETPPQSIPARGLTGAHMPVCCRW